MRKLIGITIATITMSNMIFCADHVVHHAYTFLQRLASGISKEANDGKEDINMPPIKPVTQATVHMAKGAVTTVAAAVPLCLAALCRPDQIQMLDVEFIAGASAMPMVPFTITYIIEAGDKVLSKGVYQKSCYTWQDVANSCAQAAGSCTVTAATWLLILYAYSNT